MDGNMRCDWTAYLNRYADLKRAFGNSHAKAQKHWIEFGKREKRCCGSNAACSSRSSGGSSGSSGSRGSGSHSSGSSSHGSRNDPLSSRSGVPTSNLRSSDHHLNNANQAHVNPSDSNPLSKKNAPPRSDQQASVNSRLQNGNVSASDAVLERKRISDAVRSK